MKMTKTYLPNLITGLRIAGAAILVGTAPLSPWFYAVYTFCGLTDVLDGWLARRLKAASEFGARLDSVADLLFYAVMLTKLLPLLWRMLPSVIWYAVGAVLLLRLCSYAAAAVKYRRFASLHTYLNKLTGGLIFLIPYVLHLPFAAGYCWLTCAVAAIAAAEELLIHLRGAEETKGR